LTEVTMERLVLRRIGQERAVSSFAEDVRSGLTASPKTLPPKYLYDELGSVLFEAITLLPEYHLTRAEVEILEAHAPAIAGALRRPVRLVELGSGNDRKARLLIAAILARQEHLPYLPIDISESALTASAERLLKAFDGLSVLAFAGEYAAGLGALAREPQARGHGSTLVAFLGSTLGNLDPEERIALLASIRQALAPGDVLLLGVDLKKPARVLVPAYDDPLGVTAAFDLNLLVRINRELGGEFEIGSFRHRARYDQRLHRIEMHLESRRRQTVRIRDLGLEVPFVKGETIHTESSYRFDEEGVDNLARATGFRVLRSYGDSERRFASFLLGVGFAAGAA
jgi:L-histidine Nalpha-methyltransferase